MKISCQKYRIEPGYSLYFVGKAPNDWTFALTLLFRGFVNWESSEPFFRYSKYSDSEYLANSWKLTFLGFHIEWIP